MTHRLYLKSCSSFVTRCLAALVLLSALSDALLGADIVGWVVEVEGDWIRNGKRNEVLKYNTALYAADVLEPASLSADAEVFICLFDGKPLTYRYSKSQGKFAKQPLKPVEPLSLFQRLGNAWMSRSGPIAVSAIARDGGRVVDAPARLSAGGLDLKEPLVAVAAGKYTLRLVRSDSDGRPATPRFEMSGEIQWDSNAPALFAKPNVPAGLYQISVARLDEKNSTVSPAAYVLAVPENAYNTIAKQFQEARQICQKWPEPFDEAFDFRAGFLRSVLLTLSEKTAP